MLGLASGTSTAVEKSGKGGRGIRFDFTTLCAERGCLVSPSMASSTGEVSSAFTSSAPLTAAVASCP